MTTNTFGGSQIFINGGKILVVHLCVPQGPMQSWCCGKFLTFTTYFGTFLVEIGSFLMNPTWNVRKMIILVSVLSLDPYN
jgi:hypothetical protein